MEGCLGDPWPPRGEDAGSGGAAGGVAPPGLPGARKQWREPVLGTGLGAEQEASQLSRAERDLGHPPQATSGSTKSPHLGRQDGTWACCGLPASVGLLGNAHHLSSDRRGKPGRAGEGATLLPVPAWGPFPESLPIFSGALAVAMETPHPPQGALRGNSARQPPLPALCGLRVGLFSQLDPSQWVGP